MKVSAKLHNLRISPRKTRLVANLIKGSDVQDALVELRKSSKKSSNALEKLLNSAIANAENNSGLDKNNLYIYDIQVGEGMKYKRHMPRAYGRASLIIKRGSNIKLVLEEVIEGQNRKEVKKNVEDVKVDKDVENVEEDTDVKNEERYVKKDYSNKKDIKQDKGKLGSKITKFFRRKAN